MTRRAQTDPEAQAEQRPVDKPMRLIDLAKDADMLPELLPGTRIRPGVENPRAWLFRAVKLRFRLTDEDRITKIEFDARVAEIANVQVR